MNKNSYYQYHHDYTSTLLRGTDLTLRPQLTQELTLQHAGPTKTLLDIGCGSAYKTVRLSNYFEKIVGLDPSFELLREAQNNIQRHKIANLDLIQGVAESIPLQNQQFDVVTSVLSWWDLSEVKRVLKPNGLFLIECLGPDDKKIFTQFFGKDTKGWRGANLNTNYPQMKQDLILKLYPAFNAIEIHSISWQTSYCAEGLWLLLNNTKSTVRNFDAINDRENFNRAIQQLQVNNEIVLTQNRLVVLARNESLID